MTIQFGQNLNETKQEITAISSKSFLYLDASIEEDNPPPNKYDVVLSSLIYTAMNLSLSIRFLISWGLIIPAIALIRVRLEQTIIFSYLVWEKPEKGLIPYIAHVPVHDYLGTVKAISDNEISKYIKVDIEKFEEIARTFQKVTKPNFDSASEKYERKWTKLDLLSMIRHRDRIVNKTDGSILRSRLEKYYHSIYYEASSIIHSDCNSTTSFLRHYLNKDDGKLIIRQTQNWDEIVLSTCADLDILQTYEYLLFRGCKHDVYFQELNDNLKKLIKSLFGPEFI